MLFRLFSSALLFSVGAALAAEPRIIDPDAGFSLPALRMELCCGPRRAHAG